MLRQIVKLHYNYRYSFLQPTLEEVVDAYNGRHHAQPSVAQAAPAVEPAPSPPANLPNGDVEQEEDEVGADGNCIQLTPTVQTPVQTP